MTEAAAITTVLRTLADPTRRAVFERIVSADEITVVELTHGSGVTQGAISQHLKSLRLAGLVAERPEGRKVFYRARPEGLAPLREWLAFYERFWTDRLDVLERILRKEDERKSSTPKNGDDQ
jgi:DNA-binding transcriptional ArsR family regulator